MRDLSLLIPYLRRYRLTYLAGSVLILASVVFKLLIPYLLGDSIDQLRGLTDADTLPENAGALVTQSALIIVVTALIGAGTRTFSRLLILGNSRRVVHDLRNVVFDHLLRLAPSFYIRNPTGQIMSRCINDVQYVQGLMGPVIMYFAETLTLFFIAITIMLNIDARLTILGLLPLPITLFLARRVAARIQEGSREVQDSLAKISEKVDESLSGQLVIKTLTLEDHDRAQFHDECSRFRRLSLYVTKQRSLLVPMMLGLSTTSTIVLLAIGGPQVARGAMSLGSLVTLLLYMQMMAGPTRTLGFIISSLRRGASALGRIREILDSEVAIRSLPDARQPEAVATPVEIDIRGLSVTYPPLGEQPHLTGSLPELTSSSPAAAAALDTERRVLRDVSVRIPAGTTLGVVGHTGSGKTTLVRALARLLEVEPGRIFFDGIDITELDVGALRRQVGVMPQEAFLFSRTLADNIALGAPAAERAAVEAATGAARLTEDLPQLPDGLDTVVGERGVNLSGGQRQRAALARVLLLSPRLVILDDTLSAVDTDTADAILAHLRSFGSARTTVIVAHRLSTLQHADHIIVLEEGEIVEQGTHAQLIDLNGRYARLYAEQETRHAQSNGSRDLNGGGGDVA